MADLFRSPNCSTCLQPTPSTPPPLSWSPAIVNGHRVWTCPECARANLRSIEGRLDLTWW